MGQQVSFPYPSSLLLSTATIDFCASGRAVQYYKTACVGIRNTYCTELGAEGWTCLLLSHSLSTLLWLSASVENHLFLTHALLCVRQQKSLWLILQWCARARFELEFCCCGRLHPKAQRGWGNSCVSSLLHGWGITQGAFWRVRSYTSRLKLQHCPLITNPSFVISRCHSVLSWDIPELGHWFVFCLAGLVELWIKKMTNHNIYFRNQSKEGRKFTDSSIRCLWKVHWNLKWLKEL